MTHAIVAAFTALALAAEPAAPVSGPAPVTAEPAPAPAPATPPPSSNAADWAEVERSTTTTTTTTTTTSNVPPPVVTPSPTPAAPPPPRRTSPAGNAMVGIGGGLMGLGAISLIFIAGPAAIVKRSALRRAEDEDALAFSSRRERLDRARNADNTMEGAFWAGVSGLGVGIVLLTAGLVVRSRAEAPPRTAMRARRSIAKVRFAPTSDGFRLRF